MTADSDGTDEYADYVLNLTPRDWTGFDTLRIKLWTACGAGCNSNSKVRVYIHDADGTGNSDGNGYHNLGDVANANGTVDLSFARATNRNQVNQVLIRVAESFFGGVGHAGAYQSTTCSVWNWAPAAPASARIGRRPATTRWEGRW